jgi:hypothetical protein
MPDQRIVPTRMHTASEAFSLLVYVACENRDGSLDVPKGLI